MLAAGAGRGHPNGVWGLDSRTVAVGVLGLLIAVALGGAAGRTVGATAGALTAVAGLVSSAVLALALERRSRNVARARRRDELLEMFAPPEPSDEGEGER
jgi:hypothetical protein